MTAAALEYPCDIAVKAMGRSGTDFDGTVVAIVRRHVPHLAESAVSLRPSSAGNYVAVTVLVRAESQAQMDALYRDLTACEQVLMAL